ncbi:MAG: enoyl-CoA hydratase/isomerase family protein [Actinomycetota bacterium]
MPDLVSTERRDDGVAIVRLDNPPVNALSRAVLGKLASAARELSDDDSVKAAVVTGEGKAFAAGADISEFGDGERAREIGAAFRAAFDGIAAIPRPVLAAVHGVALGGGMELALACDLRIAADSARLGQPEILLGIIPGAGATQRLPRLVGPARAKELIWSGRQVKAEEARAIGFVDRVVPADELLDAALAWAGELATGAVVAMGMAKRAIDAGLDGPLGDGLDLERDAFVEVFDTDDAQTGVRSFLEHGPGKAKFAGR